MQIESRRKSWGKVTEKIKPFSIQFFVQVMFSLYSSNFSLVIYNKVIQENSAEKSEAYEESCLSSRMECFMEMFNGLIFLSISAKRSVLDVWQSSEYTVEAHLFV